MDEFDERLKLRLQEGIDRLNEEVTKDRQFQSGWQEARRETVLPILKRAGEAMSRHQSFGYGHADYDNGGVVLEVFFGKPGSNPSYRLRFSPRPEDRKIVRSFEGRIKEEEPYELENLGPGAVEQIVEDFIRAIHEDRIATRSR